MLPIVTRVYTLPFGSIIENIEVNYHGENTIQLQKNVKPAILPSPIGTKEILQEDIEIYSSRIGFTVFQKKPEYNAV